MTGKESRLMPDTLHQVFIISNTLIYMLCKPILRVLAGKSPLSSGKHSLAWDVLLSLIARECLAAVKLRRAQQK